MRKDVNFLIEKPLTNNLESANKLINALTKMYPSITIDDGEGIPYSK